MYARVLFWSIIPLLQQFCQVTTTKSTVVSKPMKVMVISNTRKMVPITGRMSTFLEIFEKLQFQSKLNPNQIQIQSIPFFSSSASRANLSCVIATIFTRFAFLSSSVSMINLSRLKAVSFSSLALLSSSVSMANLSCSLATTFSSLRLLSNSLSSPRFLLLRVGRRCYS